MYSLLYWYSDILTLLLRLKRTRGRKPPSAATANATNGRGLQHVILSQQKVWIVGAVGSDGAIGGRGCRKRRGRLQDVRARDRTGRQESCQWAREGMGGCREKGRGGVGQSSATTAPAPHACRLAPTQACRDGCLRYRYQVCLSPTSASVPLLPSASAGEAQRGCRAARATSRRQRRGLFTTLDTATPAPARRVCDREARIRTKANAFRRQISPTPATSPSTRMHAHHLIFRVFVSSERTLRVCHASADCSACRSATYLEA